MTPALIMLVIPGLPSYNGVEVYYLKGVIGLPIVISFRDRWYIHIFFGKWAHWWRHRHWLDRFRFQNFQSLAPYICMEKLLIISNDFSSEASGPVLLKFHSEPPWAGEWKIAQMGIVHWSKWLPCPYMVKTFKNLLHNQISPGPLSLHKLWGTGDLPKLLIWWFYVDIWHFYLQGQICFPMHLYGSYTFILKVSKWLVDQQ